MLLEGKRALITGGSGRIGQAIASSFLREGASVGILDHDEARTSAFLKSLPAERCAAALADVSDAEDVRRAVQAIVQQLGPLNILVNAHGIYPNRPMLQVSVEEWDEVFAVNVRGTMLTCQTVANEWVASGTKGSIVNLSSAAATSARIGSGHYCGSKAAVNLLTHALAIELGPHGIRVNAVSPGLVLNEVFNDASAEMHPYVRMSLQATPMHRTGRPEDIAEAVVFLASDRSEWTTGAILEVTGGSHCGRPYVPLTLDAVR
jgi:NAD(P)-dependent dehydrogenase (short-subunit alcohol dehydrogenase family)